MVHGTCNTPLQVLVRAGRRTVLVSGIIYIHACSSPSLIPEQHYRLRR